MVKTLMYCSEQIIVPENFPNILKTYAKAVIRTQPYDILRWSAAYFRCLAMNISPPVKNRLEKETKCGSITKGYLRVLVDQIGRGYFVNRDILQQKWEALCLPEAELLKYLSICRMYNWPQVHWLKLVSVMVGSLTQTFDETMTMICELLTEDVEGAHSRIPMWMFRVCYVFLAELDCSEEQTFINGRRKLKSGDLEEETEMDKLPRVMSIAALQKTMLNELEISPSLKSDSDVSSTISTGKSEFSTKAIMSDASSYNCAKLNKLFVERFGDSKRVINHSNDFDSLILLVNELQEKKSEDLKIAYNITSKNIQHAKHREMEIADARQKQDEKYEDIILKHLQQEKLNLKSEIAPPWSWIHQFISENCVNKSFNFVELEESIISDATPLPSSDESFDFQREKRIVDMIPISSGSSISIHSEQNQPGEIIVDSLSDDESFKPLQKVLSCISTAESQGKISSSEVASIISLIEKEEMDRTYSFDGVDIGVVKNILRVADEKKMSFESIEELIEYIKAHYSGDQTSKDDGIFDQMDGTSKINSKISESHVSIDPSILQSASESNESTEMDESKMLSVIEGTVEAVINKREINSTAVVETSIQKEETTFSISETDVTSDASVLAKKISDMMALSVGDKPKDEAMVSKERMNQSSSTLLPSSTDIPSETLSHQSLETQQTVEEEECIKKRTYLCGTTYIPPTYYIPPDFICVCPPCPGIGSSVKKTTMENFLTYMKNRSRVQKGLVMPRNFKEDKCPQMTDSN